MIRFRLGQSWKREAGVAPQDAFGLELDGVDVLAQASEEALEQVVPELAEAVHALSTGERLAQLSLPEAHLELCFLREGVQAELRVAALSRPCRLLRRLEVDLSELREATARCARTFLKDLAERSRDRSERLRKRLERKLTALEHRPLAPQEPGLDPGFSYRAVAAGRCAFGFWLRDPQDRIRAFQTRRPGGLASLLCDGETWLRAGSHHVWTVEGPPALTALELSRQAADLAQAIDSGDRSAVLQLSGHGAALTLERVGGRFASPSHPDLEARALARAMCELGLALAFAVVSRHRPQARNPYLTDLSERCRDVLAGLRESAEPDARGVARAARPAPSGKPLAKAGRLRRLRLDPLWQKQNLGGDEPGQLRIGPRGPVFVSPGMACAFSPSGQLLFRHVATNGVAADGAGRVLTAAADRIVGFQGKGPSARWIRDHDGVPLGPDLWSRDGLWLTLSNNRVVVAFESITGRELWRLAPPRTQRCHVSIQAHRALVATDAGYLYGLDLHDGQVRYRMRANLPFTAPLVAWGRRAVGALGGGDAGALFVSDAHRGSVLWAHEMTSRLSSTPLASHSRVLVTTSQGEEGALICFTSKGERAWERPLQLGPGPFTLLALDRATVVASRSGAAVRVESDGRVAWRVGAAGDALSRTVEPRRSRGLLWLAGQMVRAVDPASGEVVGEVSAGPGLCSLQLDARVNLYLLGDEGTLRALRLGTHLSVVDRGK